MVALLGRTGVLPACRGRGQGAARARGSLQPPPGRMWLGIIQPTCFCDHLGKVIGSRRTRVPLLLISL